MKTAAVTAFAAFAALLLAPSAFSAGDPEIAALQVGLRSQGLYAGTVDGVLSETTVAAITKLQRGAGVAIDGLPGARTRTALGRYGKSAPLGRRRLTAGMRGWDVAALQFALAWHGFPSGNLDGHFGPSTDSALRRFQRWAGLRADGRAGSTVVAALKAPLPTCPIRLIAPVARPVAGLFGPRGNRFHSGIDYPGAAGTRVTASAPGRVTFAGWSAGGWGYLVTIAHSHGVQTLYAHLSRVGVRVGQRVRAGQPIGRVGASGHASGPHLHFEVRLRGAAIDPLTGLS
jgi:peptidoglycan hydrolase-like protein with peptidoglycan-binding domain